jgi:hypothetical protein
VRSLSLAGGRTSIRGWRISHRGIRFHGGFSRIGRGAVSGFIGVRGVWEGVIFYGLIYVASRDSCCFLESAVPSLPTPFQTN